MTIVSIIFRILISSFGYVLPTLNTIKAIIQQDTHAYRHWATFWVTLSLLAPMLSYVPPILHLIFLFWMSLPKYQGARLLYENFFLPLFCKYEDDIDEQLMAQREKIHENTSHYLQAQHNTAQLRTLLHSTSSIANSLFQQFHAAKESERLQEMPLSNLYDAKSHQSLSAEKESLEFTPQHSVRDALSPSKRKKDENYVSLFLSMLSKGLYVFVKLEFKSGGKNASQKRRKSYQLRVLSISSFKKVFLISGVDSNDSSLVTVPVSEIKEFLLVGRQEISIVFAKKRETSKNIDSCIISLADAEDCKLLLPGLNACLFELTH
mmetsp:Transcript_22679/g.29061  ORF Transcript_22679/g.29061 Transcript_22679/m.29061 type:complete len:321 (-) Transcript_22679:210-1172(-)